MISKYKMAETNISTALIKKSITKHEKWASPEAVAKLKGIVSEFINTKAKEAVDKASSKGRKTVYAEDII